MSSNASDPVRVLFVCLGNICRSPTADAVFRHRAAAAGLSDRVVSDSAATHGFHIGRPPDWRAQQAARERGYDMGGFRARQVGPEDFACFDYVLAMDEPNYSDLVAMASAESRARLARLLDYLEDDPRTEVPDPYYGGANGFEHVLDLIEAASDALLDRLRSAYRLG